MRNRYRVVSRLGRGGGGTVFAVDDLACPGPQQRLALKALFCGSADNQQLVAVLRQEFRVLAMLRHPLLAHVYDFGRLPPGCPLDGAEGRGGFFFTRDLIEGRDLIGYCEEGRRDVASIARVFARTAEVLDVLHRAGMIHGDFKPANVIVSDDGQPHLIDFGLVRSEGQATVTSGTAAFLPPEVINNANVDRRADLYSFGISLYYSLTGALPLPNATLPQLVYWHVAGDPLRIGEKRSVPDELDELVFRLTQRDPDRRLPTAAEVALVLGRVVEELEGAPAPGPEERSAFVAAAPGESLNAPLRQLEQEVAARLDGSGGAALHAVVGEPGSGKSTLLRELAWRFQLADVEVLRGAFNAGDPRPYGPLAEMLAQISWSVDGADPLAADRGDGPSGEAASYGVFQEIAAYLERAAATTPLLLLLDDVGQADAESRAALRFLAHTLDAGARVAIVVGHNEDHQLSEALAAPAQVTLTGLDRDEVARMLQEASGRADEAIAERIVIHTGGNPQFVVDVLHRLWREGWPPNPDLQQLAPPSRLEDVFARRWADLAPGEQAVLEALAVFGRPAAGMALFDIVCATSDDRRSVGLPLERLEASGWLVRAAGGAWAFRQGSAANIVYGWIEPARRRALHRAVVAQIDDEDAIDIVERTRHALAAGELELAWECFELGLARLRNLGAHRRAIDLCQAALAALEEQPGDERVGALRCQLGELLRLVGDYERAEQVLGLEVAAQGAGGDQSARLELARVHCAAGAAPRALELLEELLGHGGDDGEARLAARVCQAAALTALDDHEAVLQAVEQGLEIEAEATDVAARAELLGRQAWSFAYLQRYEEATAAFKAALADARAARAARAEANILNQWAVAAFRQGDYEGVELRYRQALEAAAELGDLERQAVISFNLGTYQLSRGIYAPCLELLQQSLRLFEAMGSQQNAASARCNLGQLQLELGLYEQARTSLQRAREAVRQAGRRSGEALATLLLALVDARRGRLAEAREGVAAARRIYAEVGQRRDAADALLDLAEVELDAGEVAAAARSLQQAGEEVELDSLPDLAARAAALAARLRSLRGEASPAAEQLRRAFALAETLDSPQTAWQCHAAAMEVDARRGDARRAAEHARRAAAILEQMAGGLPPEVHTAFWTVPRRREARQRATGETPSPRIPGPSDGANVSDQQISATDDPTLLAGTMPPESQHGSAGAERFYRLLEIYRQINAELDPERLLGLVMNTAVELTGAERGFLLLGESPAQLKVEVARNIDPEGEGGAYSRSIAERVFTSGRPVVTVSAHNDPRFSDYASVHQLQLESVLCIPVHARDRTAGVLYMESRFQSGRFTPEDQRLLMAFGDQVAIALTNARLYAENVRKTEELQRAKQEIEALAEERGRLLEERTAELEQVQRDLAETRRHLETRTGRFGLIGRSAPMTRLFEMIERVAGTDVPVLIEGQSGTGKEMVARAVHGRSARKKKRLVSVNCAAIPENLLESELFGHVRGAFTGADRDRKGLFSVADGGSLFLDEIGDMPQRMQVDLLRALQEKTIRPVGGQQDIEVDVRVLAASNKSLAELVRQGRFREDLFYRLHVVRLELPPLWQRTDDIPLLVDHFLGNIAQQMGGDKRKITRGALKKLVEYSWPGNVRQLEHALMNAAVLAEGAVLGAEDFTLESPRDSAAEPERPAARPRTAKDRDEQEKDRILAALEEHGWNKSKAAAALGIPRRTFYRRLRSYGII